MDLTLIITGGVLLGCLIGLSWFAGTDAPYVPTKNERIKKALQAAELKKGETFYELGSGDGRVVIEAARMGALATGIEQSWLRVLWSRLQAFRLRLPNAHFIHGNIFEVGPLNTAFYKRSDLYSYVIFIFLLPKGVEKLEPILKKNLKKGSRVITQTFHFKNWQPIKKVLVTDKKTPNTALGKGVVEGDFWIYEVK